MYLLLLIIILLVVNKSISTQSLSTTSDDYFKMAKDAAKNGEDYLDVALFYWNSFLLSPGIYSRNENFYCCCFYCYLCRVSLSDSMNQI